MTEQERRAGMKKLAEAATLREANALRQKEWDTAGQITLAYRGNELAGEVGEACNVIKKLERERMGIQGSRDTNEHLAEELADIVICTDLIAMDAGIDLDAAVEAKFNSTSEKVGLRTRLALTAKDAEIAALKEKVKRQAEALTLAANAYERGQRDGIAAAVKATQALYDLMLDAQDITVVSAKQYATDGLLDVIDALQALSPGEWVAVPAEKWTYGHCKEKVKPGGCQLHNLQCNYPDCDRRAAQEASE